VSSSLFHHMQLAQLYKVPTLSRLHAGGRCGHLGDNQDQLVSLPSDADILAKEQE
jgi:hypothetical protein